MFKRPAIGRPVSRQARSRIQRPAISAISTNAERKEEQEDDQLGDLDGFRASSRLSHRDAHSGEFDFGFEEGQEPRGRFPAPLALRMSLTVLKSSPASSRKSVSPL